jgi:glycosyltransferase involved in cell wall biosynthesis
MDAPTISICIPTFNRARYLPAALASALRQTRADFEIIVSDDASSDDTPSAVAAFDDPRIRYVRSRRRAGIASNRNCCLELARGRYIAWLDSDDMLHSEMLARQSAVLDTHANVGLVHGAFHVIGEAGQRLPDWPSPHEHDTIVPSAAAFRELVVCNYVATPTVLIRRELHDQAGPLTRRSAAPARTGTCGCVSHCAATSHGPLSP